MSSTQQPTFEELFPELSSLEDHDTKILIQATCISKSVTRNLIEQNFNGLIKDQILSFLNLQ